MDPLSTDQIDTVFVQLCRTINRRKWWKCTADRASGPIGRMFDELVGLTKHMRPTDGRTRTHDEDLLRVIQALQAAQAIDPNARFTQKNVAEFLAGRAGRQHQCFEHSQAILGALLRGVDVREQRSTSKVERFLLPGPAGEVDGPQLPPLPEEREAREAMSFFHPALRFPAPASPQRICEVEAEHERLRILQTRKTPCWIIRVAAGRRFLVVDTDGSLSPVGEATVECLKAGVKCVFVYPAKGFDRAAQDSLEDFKAALHRREPRSMKRMPFFEVPLPGQNESSHGSGWDRFFTNALRTVLFRSAPLDAPDTRETWTANNTVMFTLRSSVLLSTHDCSWTEFDELMQWVRTFVVPELPEDAVARGDRPPAVRTRSAKGAPAGGKPRQ